MTSRRSVSATDAPERSTRATGRYRKVEVRTWGDERFRALSPLPPCGQGLWLYLITGPHTGPIPGLFSAGPASMAEDLGWSLDAFMHAMGEAIAHGMVKADFSARVVFIPKAIQHNSPAAPNQVKTWGLEFELIPECDLKREAYETLKASIHALGDGFAKSFDMAWRKPSPKPSAMPSPMLRAIQEQEQEQEYSEAKASAANAATSAVAQPKPLTAKDRVWVLGVALLGEKARSLLGKLSATYGDELVSKVLAEATTEQPIEPKAWVVAACESQAQSRPKPKNGNGGFTSGTDVQALLDRDQHPQWVVDAGFEDIWQAENAGCFEANHSRFRDGAKLAP